MCGGEGLFHRIGLDDAVPVPSQLGGNPGPSSRIGVRQQNSTLARLLLVSVVRWFQLAGRNGLVGKENAECGTTDGIALSPNSAGMLQNDGAANGQAEAAASLLP